MGGSVTCDQLNNIYIATPQTMFQQRPLLLCSLWVVSECCQSNAAISDLSIVVAFGHNELWWPEAANRVSVISQVLWPSAITNSGSRRPLKWLVSWLKTRQMATLGRVRWTQNNIVGTEKYTPLNYLRKHVYIF